MTDIEKAVELIKKAAELGILIMPDPDHVWVAWQFEDGAEGWKNENLLTAAIDLSHSPENIAMLEEEIRKREAMPNTEMTEESKAKALAAFIAKNWHFCPINEIIHVPGCMFWGSDMCPSCILEHSNSLGGE